MIISELNLPKESCTLLEIGIDVFHNLTDQLFNDFHAPQMNIFYGGILIHTSD